MHSNMRSDSTSDESPARKNVSKATVVQPAHNTDWSSFSASKNSESALSYLPCTFTVACSTRH
jgi:hypothetical protein